MRALLAAILCVSLGSASLVGQDSLSSASGDISTPARILQMVGRWKVQQRMWPGPDAPAVNMPAAVARRRLIDGGFVEEVMEPAPGAKGPRFTRIAYFNYNAVNQQYEYFSIDSRVPQMMNEKSAESRDRNSGSDQGVIMLYGDSFVAPTWGPAKNVAFRYRLGVGAVRDDQQTVRLYLTPQSGQPTREFLAFEYVYTRER